jgi:hypothetical protein
MQTDHGNISPEEIQRSNDLISSFGELLENARDRYLQQASELLEKGSLEIFRGNCEYRYQLNNDNLTFHVNRLVNNTSYSGQLPLPQSSHEVIEKIVTVFAQSEAASRI